MNAVLKKFVRQHEENECAAACLTTILNLFGCSLPLIAVREKIKMDKNGASVLAIVKTAEIFHLKTNAYQTDWDELYNEVQKKHVHLPLMVHIVNEDQQYHFIVVYKIRKNKVYIFDPGKGILSYSVDTFDRMWTGVVLAFQKTEDFSNDQYKIQHYYWCTELIKSQSSKLSLLLFLALMICCLSILVSFGYQSLIDIYLIKNGEGILLKNISFKGLIVLLIGSYIGIMFLSLLQGKIMATAVNKIENQLDTFFFEKLMKLPLKYFYERESGGVLTRFQDITFIKEVLSSGLLSFFMNCMMLIVGVIFLLQINVRLFLVVLIYCCSYTVVLLLYKRPMENTNRLYMEERTKLISNVKSTVDGIDAVKGFDLAVVFSERFNKIKNTFLLKSFKVDSLGVTQNSIVTGIEGIGNVVILLIGSMLVINHRMTLGTLILFLSLMNYFISPVQSILALQPVIMETFITAERLNDVFMAENESDIFWGTQKLNSVVGEICIQNMNFQYTMGNDVLKNLSMCIKPFNHVALVGESGCGKSTLIKLIAAIYPFERGKIFLDGLDYCEISIKDLRANITYVSQNTSLFQGTIRENLCVGRDVDDKILTKVCRGCLLDEMFEQLPNGINTNVGEQGNLLSGGQKQRIIVARALLSNSKILLFDEAMGHLDAKNEKQIFSYIHNNYKDRTCIFVTHNLQIAEMCDDIYLLKNGKIQLQGAPCKIRKMEEYQYFCGDGDL